MYNTTPIHPQLCLIPKQKNVSILYKSQLEQRFDDLKKRKEAGEKLSDREKSFMKGFGAYRAVGQQVNYNSEAYCLDYSQYATKYYASHAIERQQEVSKEVRELADAVRDNKPASMAEMTALATKLGLKLRMTNDPHAMPTPEEIAKGIKVVYIAPAGKDEHGVDQVGHAFFIDDENGNKSHVESKPNDCFYAVCSKILETTEGIGAKSIDQLRQITAVAIEANGNFGKALEGEKWIRDRCPQDANTLLFSAGIRTDAAGNLSTEAKDIIDLINQIIKNIPANKRGGMYSVVLKVCIKFRWSFLIFCNKILTALTYFRKKHVYGSL